MADLLQPCVRTNEAPVMHSEQNSCYHESYPQLHHLLAALQPGKESHANRLIMERIPFHSDHAVVTNTQHDYAKNRSFKALLQYYLSRNIYSDQYIFQSLQVSDADVVENQNFYPVLLRPDSDIPARQVIVLLNGLNEKSWDKYLPWADALVGQTGAAVLLFPTAFHMDRVPAAWSDAKLMRQVSKERQSLFPEVTHATFANAAISHRLQFAPERFLTSGLQTYHDMVSLAWQIRGGQFPHIHPEAAIDLFGYSAGAFLGEILMMASPSRLFDESRLFMFCGGATMNQSNPISKMILDSEASASLFAYLESFEQHAAQTPLPSESDLFIKAMLHENQNPTFRTQRFAEIGSRMLAVSLEGDSVIPADAIEKTLSTPDGKGPHVVRLDFSHPYTHETPFPISEKYQSEVQHAFNQVMTWAADFYRQS